MKKSIVEDVGMRAEEREEGEEVEVLSFVDFFEEK